jgi:thiamine biosynthesis protein ThiI
VKAVALLSGGIDSPVAVHLMLRRGVEVVPLHMDNWPFNEGSECEKVRLLVGHLSRLHGTRLEAYQAPHGDTHQVAASERNPPRLRCVLCKRGMLRTAEALCGKVGAGSIITGESLGQVASQTLPNLRVEDSAVKVPVLRPLIGMDKVEIIDIAREIGTFGISTMPGDCCTFVPDRPATCATAEEIVEAEARFPADGMARESMAGLKRIEF